jgi:hypothetical protein
MNIATKIDKIQEIINILNINNCELSDMLIDYIVDNFNISISDNNNTVASYKYNRTHVNNMRIWMKEEFNTWIEEFSKKDIILFNTIYKKLNYIHYLPNSKDWYNGLLKLFIDEINLNV